MAIIASQDTVVMETRAVIRALQQCPNSAFAHLIPSYIASFKSSAYRVLGLFPTARNATLNRTCAAMSGRCAARAMEELPPTDYEYVASLRDVMDSSIELGERDAFLGYLKIAQRIMPTQPAANFLSTMGLAATVGKGMAVFRIGDPFALKEEMERYFGRSLVGARVFELSDLKAELETYVALRVKKDAFITQRIQRALTLADEESTRYKDVILGLAGRL